MNMKVLNKHFFKCIVISTTILSSFTSKLAHSDTVTVYGTDAADRFKKTHPHAVYSIQLASFNKKTNAELYLKNMQNKCKYKLYIKPKLMRHQYIYAVVTAPIYPNNKPKINGSIAHFSKLDSISAAQKTDVYSASYENSSAATTRQDSHLVDLSKKSIRNKQTTKTWLANGNWYLSLGGGEQFPNNLKTLYVNNGSTFSSPYDHDIYSNSSQKNSGIFALIGGRSWNTENYYIKSYSLGVMWQHLFTSNVTGQITQYSDPDFLNYNYKLSSSSNIILGYSKINIFSYKNLLPYFNVGLGGALNRTQKYHEEALDFVTARVSPGYKSNSNSQFAYLLGAGLDLLANDNLSLSAGYNYLNIGSLSTGYGTSTWSAARLNYGSSSTNEVLITLNYKFNKNRILP